MKGKAVCLGDGNANTSFGGGQHHEKYCSKLRNRWNRSLLELVAVKIVCNCFQISSDTLSIRKKLELTKFINIFTYIQGLDKPRNFEDEADVESKYILAWRSCFLQC